MPFAQPPPTSTRLTCQRLNPETFKVCAEVILSIEILLEFVLCLGTHTFQYAVNECFPRIINFLKDKDPRVRSVGARAFGSLASHRI